MRHLVIFIACLWSVTTACRAQDEESATRFRALLSASVEYLERTHGIAFEKRWSPTVVFGMPEPFQMSESQTFEACYEPGTERFFFVPRYAEMEASPDDFKKDTLFGKSDTSLLAAARFVVCHELGHAYADQVSRRMGLGQWPLDEFGDTKSGLLVDMLAEGVGEYFGKSIMSDKTEIEMFVEDLERDDFSPAEYERAAYDGGYWLVRPIFETFGVEKGTEYMVSHPIPLVENSIRQSAYAYWETAFRELSASRK
jgi:hypothetical protein